MGFLNKNNNFSTWETLKIDYLNDEKKNHREITIRDLEFIINKFFRLF